jgi:hypothetical protein
VAGGVPAVEVADDGDGGGVGGPDGEVGAVAAVDGEEVGAELVVEIEVVAFLEEVDVGVGEEGRAVEDAADGGDLDRGGGGGGSARRGGPRGAGGGG